MQSQFFGVLALLAALVTRLASEPVNDSVFRSKLQPVLQKECGACHSGTTTQGGFSVNSLDDLLKGGKHGAAIRPGDSKASLLVQYILGEKSPKMPLGGSLSAAASASIIEAIDAMKPATSEAPSVDAHVA